MTAAAPSPLLATPIGAGTTLLEASAGTGKTYTLVGMVLRLLLEGHAASLSQVLVVTFTVAATEELKTRLRAALIQARAACCGEPTADPVLAGLGATHGPAGARILDRALREFDEVAVHTIHGFCKRLLEEAAFECRTPFRSEFAEDEVPPTHQAATEAFRAFLRRIDPFGAAVAAAAGIEPDSVVATYLRWRRHPDVVLLPPEEPTDEGLAEVRAAIEATLAALPGDLTQALAGIDHAANKAPPPAFLTPGILQERIEASRGDGPGCLPLLLQFDGSRLQGVRRSKNFEKNGVFAAAARLRKAVDRTAHAMRWSLLRDVDQRLHRQKVRHNVLLFQDLLERVHAALHDPQHGRALVAAVQARHAAALIDEFQDTDRLQYEIFATCFRNRPLFLIGDPKQSIYGFRGADVHAYLAAQRDATARSSLQHNFRSHPDLVRSIIALFRRCQEPFLQAGIAMPDVTPARTADERALPGDPAQALQWRFVPPAPGEKTLTKDGAEVRVVADLQREITGLLRQQPTIDGRPLRPSDIAVLTRTNAQAVAVQDALREALVHSAIGKAGDVFECDEIEEWSRILEALLQPHHHGLVRAAWATRLWGRDGLAIHAIDGDADWERERTELERWRGLWYRHGLVVMAEDLLAGLRVRERLLPRPDGERRVTNLLQVIELLHQAEHEHHLTPEGLLEWLRHEREHKDEIDYQRRELRLESDADAVQILTVHGAKGLEYPVVFCPFLWDGKAAPRPPFAFRDGDGRMTIDLEGDEAHKTPADRDRLQEDLRLLYVALTRAGRRCVVHLACGSNTHRSALALLLFGGASAHQDLEAAMKRSSDCRDRWLAELRAFAAAQGPAMTVVEVPPDLAPPAPLGRGLAGHGGRPRPLPASLPPAQRMLSFTALALGTAGEARPEHADPAAPADDGAERPAPGGIAAFARGPAAGLCLHAILERLDLGALCRDPGLPAARALVLAELQRHGLHDPTAHPHPIEPAAAVLAMLRDLSRARAPALDLDLGRLRPDAAAVEWQFTLPVAALRPRDLGRAFREHGEGHVRDYAARLRRLEPHAIDGFLAGFVDLVAEQQGRWFVLDWKSNHLGDDAAAYGPDARQACMHEHDYVLQYHLYVVAVHRLLQQRLPGYDYEQHFGGVCYPFLRGVRADSADGLYCDRPPAALVRTLAGLFDGGGR